MTARKFLVLAAWRAADMDTPRRADWYAMQLAAEVRRSWISRGHSEVRADQFRMEFAPAGGPDREPTAEEREALTLGAKMAWAVRLGFDQPGLIVADAHDPLPQDQEAAP